MSRKKLKYTESNPSSNTNEPGVSPPWIELPWDVTANILHRLGAVEILESAQKVCTTWWKVCQDPSMWRVIDMKNYGNLNDLPYDLEIMCRHAVDRSMGQLVEINIMFFGTDELILYISQRAPKLGCLRLTCCPEISNRGLTRAVKGFPRLEELHLLLCHKYSLGALHPSAIPAPC